MSGLKISKSWHRCPNMYIRCYGPLLSVGHFDRAKIGSAALVTNRLEVAKQARDSVVMSRDGTQFFAGKVSAFLSHSAPGCVPEPQHEANIAYVQWYARKPDTHGAANKSSPILSCPISNKSTPDHPGGNLWPVEKLAPCKLATPFWP